MPTGRRPVYFTAQKARLHAHWPHAGLVSGPKRPSTCPTGLHSGTKRPCTYPPATGRFTFGRFPSICPSAAGRFSFGCEAPVYMPTGRFTFGREAPVYMPTGRKPAYFWARSAHLHAHRPQASLLSGPKRTCTCPPVVDWYTFGRVTLMCMPTCSRPVLFRVRSAVNMSTSRRPVYFRVRSARVHAHRLQTGLLSGAKLSCTCPPVAGRFTFRSEAPVYIPFGCEAPLTRPTAAGRFSFERDAPVYMPIGRITFGR